ncbi:MAG TPA: PqqD family peptide modification chaperone [Anaerolineae bacterium]|nr:PqqD family peptide modification chaperone [Anaerolineae bacterium]
MDLTQLQRFASEFIASTRDYVFIRPEDRLLILRPNKIHHLNRTATDILTALYAQPAPDVVAIVHETATRYAVPEDQVAADLERLLQSLSLVLQDREGAAPAVRRTLFGSHARELPVLSEIALTYRCQNRCTFCYASAPERGRQVPEMTTAQVRHILAAIVDDARVPTVSFTGGEPTLRPDLPDLVAYAKGRRLRTNLITNGRRCAANGYVARLAKAGLDSAQVSLEAADPAVHDAVVGRAGAWQATVRGLRHLKAAGIHVHTNTTINHLNRDHLLPLVDWLGEMGQPYLSMNMVIRTGDAVGSMEIGYRDIGELVVRLKERAAEHGMRFVWYSPVPLCLFNPVAHGLGSQSCSAADGLLSIAPDGSVLPCSSFEQGVGNLLHEPFEAIWNRRAARYWRKKEFLPPGCRDCDLAELCCGACPLYWDERGDLSEIAEHQAPVSALTGALWRARRRWLGQVRGVGLSRRS